MQTKIILCSTLLTGECCTIYNFYKTLSICQMFGFIMNEYLIKHVKRQIISRKSVIPGTCSNQVIQMVIETKGSNYYNNTK